MISGRRNGPFWLATLAASSAAFALSCTFDNRGLSDSFDRVDGGREDVVDSLDDRREDVSDLARAEVRDGLVGDMDADDGRDSADVLGFDIALDTLESAQFDLIPEVELASEPDEDVESPDDSGGDLANDLAADATTDVHGLDTSSDLGCAANCHDSICGCSLGAVCVTGTGACESEMVAVPAGPFVMGCITGSEYHCWEDEFPAHEVAVPAFQIDRLEATVADYQACIDTGDCSFWSGNSSTPFNWQVPGLERHPADGVNWFQASTYCAWRGKRLCTEAEWEKAARGSDGRTYPWGDSNATCEFAVMFGGRPECYEPWDSPYPPEGCRAGCNSGPETMPVGSKPAGASPYGALDMAGNAQEWVEDWYHETYEGAPVDGSAWLSPMTELRAVRGGCGFYTSRLLTASKRYSVPSHTDLPTLGLRCCRSVTDELAQEVGR